MVTHARWTGEVERSAAGPQIAALFDLDRTLLAGFSASEFLRDSVFGGRMGAGDLFRTLVSAAQFQLGEIGFSGFVGRTAGLLRGVPEAEYRELGERLFQTRLAASIYPEARALVRAHQKKNHTLVIVSSATRYQVDPIANDLGITHVLCTKLEVQNGSFTGNLVRPACYGPGKALAARELADARGIDLSQSFFYTDSHEDLALLDLVGRPRPINPDRPLRSIAAKRGWPVKRFASRGVPGAQQVLRTSLAVGSMLPSFLLGVPAAILDRSWRRAINVAMATWGELGTALAGIELQVNGEQHLWSHRPAVYIFNHQSAIDVLLLCKLLRRDLVGIAKRELLGNPVFGPAFALAGTVFIDRFDREKAIEAMQPAVEALRQGLSIAIAPEGTRSPTPRLGRFKKGAFHLALAAKVPIVPIVIRNAHDVLPKHGLILRPATVEVVVHPPVFPRGWTRRNLDQKIETIRQLYLDTLE